MGEKNEENSTQYVYIMSRSNAKVVEIEEDTLKYSGGTNILWTFSKSMESVELGDKPVIESVEQIYYDMFKTKKQLDFVDTSSTVNGVGIKFSTSAFGVDFLFINDEVFETITFLNDGTEAVSSLYENANVLTKDSNGNMKIDHKLIGYEDNNKTINWEIGDLNSEKYTLEYYVYLTETTNLYDDGTLRGTGEYGTSENVYVKYTNHLNESIEKDFSIKKIDWKNDTPVNNSPVINESGEVVKTGDNLNYYVIASAVLLIVFIIIRCELRVKTKSSKK